MDVFAGLVKHFQSNKCVKEYEAHSGKVHSIAWNCDGTKLASGSLDKTVSIFRLEKDRLSKDCVFRGHSDGVDQLCWHPLNADILSTAAGDKTVRFWDARMKKSIATVNTKGENLNMTWAPNGDTVAVGNKDDIITFIDTRTFKVVAEEAFKWEVNEISWNRNSDQFYLTSGSGSVHILSYPGLKPLHVLDAHPSNCISLKFDPTGRFFAIGSADALVSIWDINELACTVTVSRLEWPVRAVSFSYDGQLLAAASEDLFIDISFTASGARVHEVPCESQTFAVAWHPRQYLLAYACDDKHKYDRNRDAGTVKLFGLPNESN